MGHARLLLAAICLAGCATESVPPPRATAPPVPAPAERAPDAEPAAAPAATATPAPPTQEMTQAPPRPPAQVENGRWRVSALSLRTAEEAGRWAARLQGEGYRVETEAAEVGGATWHRVVLTGLRTLKDARAMAAFLQQQAATNAAWVLPRAAPPAAAAPAQPPAAPADPAAPAAPAN